MGFYYQQPQKQGFYYNQQPKQGFYYNQPEGFYYNQQEGFYYDQQDKGFYYDQRDPAQKSCQKSSAKSQQLSCLERRRICLKAYGCRHRPYFKGFDRSFRRKQTPAW